MRSIIDRASAFNQQESHHDGPGPATPSSEIDGGGRTAPVLPALTWDRSCTLTSENPATAAFPAAAAWPATLRVGPPRRRH